MLHHMTTKEPRLISGKFGEHLPTYTSIDGYLVVINVDSTECDSLSEVSEEVRALVGSTLALLIQDKSQNVPH